MLLRRVSKKTSGGNYISFSALVAIGDKKGRVGFGLGRATEVPPAIAKAVAKAKKALFMVPIFKDTIPHVVHVNYKAAQLLLKPAPAGTGLKVGGVARTILDLAGVQNASGKVIGSRNQIVGTYATFKALRSLKTRYEKTIVASEPKEETSVVEETTPVPKKAKVTKTKSVKK